MRRRDLLKLFGAAIAIPHVAKAQTATRLVVLIVTNNVPERVTAFEQGFVQLGWAQGKDFRLDFRNPSTDPSGIPAVVSEVIALRPDVIVVSSTPVAIEVARQTSTIPLVFVQVSDPVGSGLVQSMARPGGNATGFTNFESSVSGKWLSFLRELMPTLVRPFMIFNPATAISYGAYYLETFDAAAASMGMTAVSLPVGATAEIEPAIRTVAAEPGQGLVVMPDIFNNANRKTIIEACAAHGITSVYYDRVWTTDGGLLAYGVDVPDIFRRAAEYAVRILEGALPSELVVQGPASFNLSINLKTARSQGINIPPVLLGIADELIE